MRILHSSDWHLGNLLYEQKRDIEHRAFLDWLLEVIVSERIDMLLVAGDVFDTGFPSNYALEMYYSFLAKSAGTGCRQVVVVGGNHDSAATLQAPRQVLQAIRVTVVGSVEPENAARDLVVATGADGTPQAIVCAVPYLRDRDVHFPQAGELNEARSEGIIEGTADWYRQLADLALLRRLELGRPDLPIIATGHLFAQGMEKSGTERELYVGDLGAFPADRFPPEFAYIALGHLHRPQNAAHHPHIRYCGSPIPLSFDEIKYTKQLFVFDTSIPGKPQEIPIPVFRPLIRITGNLQAIEEALGKIPISTLEPWVEVRYDGETLIPDLPGRVDDLAREYPVQVLHTEDVFPGRAMAVEAPVINIQTVTPEEVFAHRLNAANLTTEDRELVEKAFQEILFQVQQGR